MEALEKTSGDSNGASSSSKVLADSTHCQGINLCNSVIDGTHDTKSRTYAEIIKGKAPIREFDQPELDAEASKYVDPSMICIKPTTIQDGCPSIVFSSAEKLKLVEQLKWVLVGKFSHGRPGLKVVQTFFDKLQLQGNVNCAYADSKHLYIECSCYKDYYFIWMQLSWKIQGFTMRMFKWTSNFSPLVESSLAPVWISIQGLALYMFEESTLISIASAIGTPIMVDSRNVERSLLSTARICVEIDVSRPLVDAILINIVDEATRTSIESKKAKVLYDFVPPFCSLCSHIGHGLDKCKRKQVGLSRDSTSLLKPVVIKHDTPSIQLERNVNKVWRQVGDKRCAAASIDLGETSMGSSKAGPIRLGGLTAQQVDERGLIATLLVDKEGKGDDIAAAAEPAEQIATPEAAALSGMQALQVVPAAAEPVDPDQLAAATDSNVQPTQRPRQEAGATQNSALHKSATDGIEVQTSEQDWQTVVSKKRRGSREKDIKAKAQDSNKLVFDHSIKELLSGHSCIDEDQLEGNAEGVKVPGIINVLPPSQEDAKHVQFLRPSWADQVENEEDLATLQIGTSDTIEDTGKMQVLNAVTKSIDSFDEARATYQVSALHSDVDIDTKINTSESGLQMIELPEKEVMKEHLLIAMEQKNQRRQVTFQDHVTILFFEKDEDRRSERLTSKCSELGFQALVTEDQHNEGWHLKEWYGKQAKTPRKKAKASGLVFFS